jgi:hypothetical protein
VPAALGNTFPIITMHAGKGKDGICLLKKHGNLETNSFILQTAAGHPKDCFKSVWLTSTYDVSVSNGVDWELTKSPQLSAVTRG